MFVASDIHGPLNLEVLRPDNFPRPGKDGDFLLLCGDVGVVWDGAENDRKLAAWYDAQPYSTLYIDGNHDNHELLSRFPVTRWRGGMVHEISPKVRHLMRGQVYEVEGARIFCFGGAFSVKRVRGGSPVPVWDGEMPSAEEYEAGWSNLKAAGMEVDFIFTHTCPTSCLQKLHGDFYPHERALNDYLEEVARQVRWKRWFFGHFHADRDFGRFRALHERVLQVR